MAIAPTIPMREKALARFEPRNFDELNRFAEIVASSRLFGVQNAGGALVVMMAGAELGLGVTQSLQAIHLVKGKPVLSSDALAGLAMSHPSCERFVVVENTAERATVEVMRTGWEAPQRYSFDVDDAKRARLWGKGNWATYPADMLRARATARAARIAFADATMGIYVEEHGEAEIPGPDQLRVVADMSGATMLEHDPGVKARIVSEHMGKTRDDEPVVSVADLTDLLAAAEGVTDDLRREWCAWLCKKVLLPPADR